MQKTKISIIIPIYRVKKYLKDCLDSLIRQDFQERYNIILVETGSDDGSNEICKEYENKYIGKIYWFHYEKKENISRGRNLGILHANGEYICFVDGDDIAKENFLSSLYAKAIEEKDAMIISSSYAILNENKNEKKGFSFSFLGTGKEALLKLSHNRNSKYRGYCWGKLFNRRFILLNHIFFDEQMKIYEDVLFMNKAYYLASKVCFLPSELYLYCKHNDSTMSVNKDFISYRILYYKKAISYLYKENPIYAKKLFHRFYKPMKLQLKYDCEASKSFYQDDFKHLYKQSIKEIKDIWKEKL